MPSEEEIKKKEKGTSFRFYAIIAETWENVPLDSSIAMKLNPLTTVFHITNPVKGSGGRVRIPTGESIQVFVGNTISMSFHVKELNAEPYTQLKELRNGMFVEVEGLKPEFRIDKRTGEPRFEWNAYAPTVNIAIFKRPAETPKLTSQFPQTLFTSYIDRKTYDQLRELSNEKITEDSIVLPTPAPGEAAVKEKTPEEIKAEIGILLDQKRKSFVKAIISQTIFSGMMSTLTFQIRHSTMDDIRAFRVLTQDPEAWVIWKLKVPDDIDDLASYFTYVGKKKDASKKDEDSEEVYPHAKYQVFFKLCFKDPITGIRRIHSYDVVVSVLKSFATNPKGIVGFTHELLQINDVNVYAALAPIHAFRIPTTFLTFCGNPGSGELDMMDEDEFSNENSLCDKVQTCDLDPRILQNLNEWLDYEEETQSPEPLDIDESLLNQNGTENYSIELTACGVYNNLASYVLQRGLPISHRRACEILKKLWSYKTKKNRVYLFEYEIDSSSGKIKYTKNTFDPKLHKEYFHGRFDGLYLPQVGDARGTSRLDTTGEGYDHGIINVGEIPYKSFEEPEKHVFRLLSNAIISVEAYKALSELEMSEQERIVEELIDAAYSSSSSSGKGGFSVNPNGNATGDDDDDDNESLSENARRIRSLGFSIPSEKKFKFAIYSLISDEIPIILESKPVTDLRLPVVTLPAPRAIKFATKEAQPINHIKKFLSTPRFTFDEYLQDSQFGSQQRSMIQGVSLGGGGGGGNLPQLPAPESSNGDSPSGHHSTVVTDGSSSKSEETTNESTPPQTTEHSSSVVVGEKQSDDSISVGGVVDDFDENRDTDDNNEDDTSIIEKSNARKTDNKPPSSKSSKKRTRDPSSEDSSVTTSSKKQKKSKNSPKLNHHHHDDDDNDDEDTESFAENISSDEDESESNSQNTLHDMMMVDEDEHHSSSSVTKTKKSSSPSKHTSIKKHAKKGLKSTSSSKNKSSSGRR